MRLIRRPLAPGEPDLEGIFGWALFATAAVAWGLMTAGATLPGCPWQALIGLPCPGCGGTRALAALASGRPATAFMSNPLVTVVGFGLACWVGQALWSSLFHRPRWRIIAFTAASRWLLTLFLALNWIYLLARHG